MIDRTPELIRQRQEGNGLRAKRKRADAVTREIERLLDLAARVVGVGELAVRLEALKQEREQLASALRAAEVDVDLNALRPLPERRLVAWWFEDRGGPVRPRRWSVIRNGQ